MREDSRWKFYISVFMVKREYNIWKENQQIHPDFFIGEIWLILK